MELLSGGEVECKKCGSICRVDGDFPRYLAWCYECNDYPAGFDGSEYARNIAEGIADGHPD